MTTTMNGFEIFRDPSYFDLWAVKHTNESDFYRTEHFETFAEAVSYVESHQ